MALIELRHLSKRFGQTQVLDGVDLSIDKGESVVILGASGSGKSVMLKHIVGLLHPDSGEVWFDSKRIDTMQEQEMDETRLRFGYLFQQGALFDSLTCGQNVAFPLLEHSGKSADEIEQIAREKLTMVGLPDVMQKMPGEVSGGQRKRVALARAIALNPEVIFYDEPTTGLDPIRSDVINELILKLQDELNVTSIVVTHDMKSAFKVASRIVMLQKGKLTFNGSVEEAENSDDDHLKRFIAGEATDEELGSLTRKAEKVKASD